MMKRAGRVHGLRTLAGALGLLALLSIGLDVRRRVADSREEAVAAGLVDQVVRADIAQVPAIMKAMDKYHRWVDPALRKLVGESSEPGPERLRASLALLPVEASQVDYLFDRLRSATPSELPVLRDALKPHRTTLAPKVWATLESAKPGDASLLPAAGALASYEPENTKWQAEGDKVAQALVSVNSVFLGTWLEALRALRGNLKIPLASIFRDKKRTESERTQAINILADYAS